MGDVVENRMRASRLHERAQKLSDSGMDDEALRIYAETLQRDPIRSNTLYNMALIHKYRRNWIESDSRHSVMALGRSAQALGG